MEYEHLSYQRMLRVLENGQVCRVAVVLNGAPYLVPMCYTMRLDCRVPVIELHAYHDGDLLAALEQDPQATLEFSQGGRGGSVETVLLRGTAQVQLPCPEGPGDGCNCCPPRPVPPCCHDSACPDGAWPADGRVRFDGPRPANTWPQGQPRCGWGGAAPNSCNSCQRQNDCPSCQRQNDCGGSCSLYGGVDCEDRYDRCGLPPQCPQPPAYATICVRAGEMTGRCYPACVTRCRQDDLR